MCSVETNLTVLFKFALTINLSVLFRQKGEKVQLSMQCR